MSEDENEELMDPLEQATYDSVITCPECFNNIETDAEKCNCGYINPLRKYGFI